MPELPEVEALRGQIERYCFDSQIIETDIQEVGNGPRHGRIDELVHSTPDFIEKALLRKKMIEIKRRGKYLWIKMSNEQDSTAFTVPASNSQYILFHFGMTGSFVFKGKQLPVYQSFTISNEWPPKFTKLLIKFENGEELAFCDPRRLGRIKVMEELEMTNMMEDLAPDCFTDINLISGDYLYSKLQKYSCAIKIILLDQHKVCSGIGNWVADEVLYQSRIHPSITSNSLNLFQCNQLSAAISTVITTACSVQADSSLFPTNWIFHHRWNKRTGSKNKNANKLEGHLVKYETINGRTSAYVPQVQKLTQSGGSSPSLAPEALCEANDASPSSSSPGEDENNPKKKKQKTVSRG